MVRHIYYDARAYREPRDCLASISERLRDGWQVSAVEPAGRGRFQVVFRRDGPAPGGPAPIPLASGLAPRTGHHRLARLRHRPGRV